MQNALCTIIRTQDRTNESSRISFKFYKNNVWDSCSSEFPAEYSKALAIDAKVESGTIQDVKHIVILTQENRSFDNYFGTLKGVRGFGDRFTIPMTEGRKVWEQYDANKKKVLPYHLDSRLGNAQRVSGTPHSWSDGQAAWDNGRMSDWVAYKNRSRWAITKARS